MPRYFIQLAYDGTQYHGWQIQTNTPHTIQQTLETKLSLIFSESISIVGCGRTDAGVHAKMYYAHFDSTKDDLHLDSHKWVRKLNLILPKDIAIQQLLKVKDDANARFDAISRTYEYYLNQTKHVFNESFSLYVYGDLNFTKMNEAASSLLLYKDFTSFSKLHTQTRTNNCEVKEAYWYQASDSNWVFKITADRFLRNMVRAIVGTLLKVGKEKLTIDEFKTIIENKNRSQAGMSAAAHALFLADIQYPNHLFIE